MTNRFRKLRSAGKLSERVQAQLEEAILTGALKVNEQLPTEADLGASFGVSRTVIREALQRLEAQGLVQSRIGSGSYVAPYPIAQVKAAMGRFAAMNPQQETFLHLLDLRLVIETETSVRLAQTRDAAAIADLRVILQRMHDHRDELDIFAQADVDFHVRIAQAADNPFFPAILEAVKSIGLAFGVATYESANVVDRTYRDHAAILEAQAIGDTVVARQRMADHLAFSRAHYLELLSRAQATKSKS